MVRGEVRVGLAAEVTRKRAWQSMANGPLSVTRRRYSGRGRAPAPGPQPGAECDQAEARGKDEQIDEAVWPVHGGRVLDEG